MPKANLWIINDCILKMKADNKPAISLPVYVKSVKKKNMFYKKTKTKGPKMKEKKFLPARVEPMTSNAEGERVIYSVTTINIKISCYSKIHCIALRGLQTLKEFWVFRFRQSS